MKRRQLIYIPEIEPKTFLFFYYRGDTGLSWSLRDYTVDNPPRVTYAEAYPYSADEIIAKAQYSFDVEAVHTNRVKYWRKKIEELNQKYL